MKYIFILIVMLMVSGCIELLDVLTPKDNSFTIINTIDDRSIAVKTQDFFYEDIPCITKDTIYTFYQTYDDKKTFLTTYDMRGKFISQYKFPFNYRIHLHQCTNASYIPTKNLFIFTNYDKGIVSYDLNTEKECVLYKSVKSDKKENTFICQLKVLDENHIVFIQFSENEKNEYKNHSLKVLNINSCVITCSIELDQSYRLGAISHNKEMILLYAGYGTPSVIVSFKTQKKEINITGIGFGSMSLVAWSEDDSQLFFLIDQFWKNSKIICLDIATRQVAWSFFTHMDYVDFLCVYDKNTLLVSAYKNSANTNVYMFDVQKKKFIKEWNLDRVSGIWANPPYIIIGNSM